MSAVRSLARKHMRAAVVGLGSYRAATRHRAAETALRIASSIGVIACLA